MGKAGKTPNAYFTQVIALSDLPISDITAIWVNGEPVTVDNANTSYGNWGYPVTEYSNGSDNSMWIKFYDGSQTVADPFLVGTVSSAGRPYQATRVGAGVAYAIVTSEVNEELFTGFPTFKFEIAGAKLYDVSRILRSAALARSAGLCRAHGAVMATICRLSRSTIFCEVSPTGTLGCTVYKA